MTIQNMLVIFTFNYYYFNGRTKEGLLTGFVLKDNTVEWPSTHNAKGCLQKREKREKKNNENNCCK